MKKTLLIIALFATTVVSAQTSARERFLVPIYLHGPTPGAFGSVWVSELTVLNAGPAAVTIDNFYPSCPFECLPVPLTPGLAIRDDHHVQGILGGTAPAALLVTSAADASQLRFNLRVRDTSRHAEGLGSWLPVVHESRFTASGFDLLDVPIDTQYRHMLRVYSLNAVAPHTVRVRFYATPASEDPFGNPPDRLLAEQSLTLQHGSATQPGYAQIGDLQSLASLAGNARVRIAVVPDGAEPVWGMLSMTNNATQEVTSIFPNSK